MIQPLSWQTLAPVLFDALASSSRVSVVATAAPRVGDPRATQTVYTTIVVLVVLGIVLVALAFWVFRRTRPEAELLAPLEIMQTREWRKLSPAAQRRLLDELRPAGAIPLHREASQPAVDTSFATVAPVSSFDDLSDVETGGGKVASDDPEPDGAGEPGVADLDEAVESERPTDAADESDESDGLVDGEAEADDPESARRNDTGEGPVVDEPDADEPDTDEPDEAPFERSIDPLLTPRRTAPGRD